MNKYLAVIPARGGSQRLPRKNILELNAKPLVCWSIEAALNSKKIDKVVVSSDDEEILKISRESGATVIQRPVKLATNTSSGFEAIKHAIEAFKEEYEYIVLLQPTSPLRNTKHIDDAITLLEEKNADAVISVCEVDHPVQWTMTLADDRNMSNFVKNIDTRRSQEQETHYRLNGAIYICKRAKLLVKKSFFLEKNIYAYLMDRKCSIDIDEKIDLLMAELLLNEV